MFIITSWILELHLFLCLPMKSWNVIYTNQIATLDLYKKCWNFEDLGVFKEQA